MAIERDFELLDDYLGNRLTGGEKEAFEQQLESDPTLKSEYQLQQKLVEGIRKARVAELKTMLNNVPVPSLPTGQTLFTKVALWTVALGIIATGIYFLLNKNENDAEKKPTTIVENKIAVEPSESPSTQTTAPAVEEKANTEKPVAEVEVEKTTPKKLKSADSAKKTNGVVSQRPSVFDPTADSEGVENTGPDQPGKNEVAEGEESEVKASKIEVEMDDTNKKYTFNYQFKNGKLFLYGSFERNLYEILEFFSGNGKRTAFLYYKDNYYLLNEDNEKIKPLAPINDPALLNKLKEFRSKSK